MAISRTVIGLEDMDAAEMLIGQLETGKRPNNLNILTTSLADLAVLRY